MLARGHVIRGKVVTRADNKPVSGALVRAFGRNSSDVATADADGLFALRRLGIGTFWLSASGGGYASMEPTRVELDTQEVDDVHVIVDDAYTVAGRVAAKTTKHGIAGATVTATRSTGGSRTSGTTDDDGHFEISDLCPDLYALHASKPGLIFDMATMVELVDTDVTDVTIEVIRGATLVGRVDPTGVAQIGFGLAPDAPLDFESESRVAMVRTQSDANGAFTLRGAPSGAFEIHAMATDGQSGTLPIMVDGDRSGLLVRLSPRASIAGRVVDAKAEPVVGAHVFPRRSDLPLEKLIRRDGIFRGAVTSRDGSFKIVGLDGGRYRLSAVPRGGSSSRPQEVEAAVEDGAERTDVTITLDVPAGTIRGQVLDQDRTPAVGASVYAVPPGEDRSTAPAARTDASGSFEIKNVPLGVYGLIIDGPHGASKAVMRGVNTGDNVTVVLAPNVSGNHTFEGIAQGDYECEARGADGFAKGTVSVHGDRAQLVLALERWSSITGTIVSITTGKPVAKMLAMVNQASGETDETGRFVIDRAPPGDGELLIMSKDVIGYGTERVSYRAAPGKRVDIGDIQVVPPRAGDPGTYGLTLEIQTDTLVVTGITRSSPAGAASIVLGDLIVTIDGRAVGDLGLERAKRLLASDNITIGQSVTLGLTTGRVVRMTAIKW